MLKTARHDKILDEVQKQGLVSLAELARTLGVSEITIHRDLDELDQDGKLKRVRGGAKRPNPQGPEPPIVQRQQSQTIEKEAIASLAAGLVTDGEVIALESGSTTLELARAIARKNSWTNLQVVTNSFPIFEALVRVPGVRLVFLGGIVDPDEMGTFGTFTEDMLQQMTIDKAFLGCRGIDTKYGLSNSLQAEIEVSTVRAISAASNQTIVLADHTKFGHTFLIHMLSIQDIDAIITDARVDEQCVNEFRDQDIRVYVAEISREAGQEAGT